MLNFDYNELSFIEDKLNSEREALEQNHIEGSEDSIDLDLAMQLNVMDDILLSISKEKQYLIDNNVSYGRLGYLPQNPDANRTINFVKHYGRWSTKHYHFTDPGDGHIEVSGDYIEDYIAGFTDVSIKETIEEEVKELNRYRLDEPPFECPVRYCSICGAPMESGLTNGEMYIHSYAEFYYYMRNIYPDGIRGNEQTGEWDYYNADTDKWESTGWYYTEW